MSNYLDFQFSSDDPELISIIDELPLWSAPFGLELLNTIELKHNIKVLDIGCGTGFPLIELSGRLGNTCDLFGIDPWKEAIDRVNKKIQKLKLINTKAVVGYAENLPFETDFFDLIVSNNGINNVQDIEITLSECGRVSRNGAQFVMTMNLEESMIEFYNILKNILLKKNLIAEVKKMEKQIYEKRKPIHEIKQLVENSGFKIQRINYGSFSIKFLDATSMFNHYLIKYWFLPSWKNILKEEDQIKIFTDVEKRLNELASNNNGINLTIPFCSINSYYMI